MRQAGLSRFLGVRKTRISQVTGKSDFTGYKTKTVLLWTTTNTHHIPFKKSCNMIIFPLRKRSPCFNVIISQNQYLTFPISCVVQFPWCQRSCCGFGCLHLSSIHRLNTKTRVGEIQLVEYCFSIFRDQENQHCNALHQSFLQNFFCLELHTMYIVHLSNVANSKSARDKKSEITFLRKPTFDVGNEHIIHFPWKNIKQHTASSLFCCRQRKDHREI